MPDKKKKECQKRTGSLLNDAVKNKRTALRETLQGFKDEVDKMKLKKKLAS